MNKQTFQCQQQLSWEQIIYLLTNSSNKSQNNHHSGLKIRILDTVFFDHNESSMIFPSSSSVVEATYSNSDSNSTVERCKITQWCFTSKKGEIMRRKDPSILTLQHVYDRFCRFSLANISNASGPRIVAFGFLKKPRSDNLFESDNLGLLKDHETFTEDKLKREIKKKNNDTFGGKFSCLQCYLRPYEGRDEFYRGIYRLVIDDADTKVVKGEVLVQLIHDPMLENDDENSSILHGKSTIQLLDDQKISTMHKWIKREIEISVLKMVKHLEAAISSSLSQSHSDSNITSDECLITEELQRKILTMTSDFVLDDNKQIWLGSIDGVTLGEGKDLNEQIKTLAKETVEHNLLTTKKLSDSNLILSPTECNEKSCKNTEKNTNLNKDTTDISPEIESNEAETNENEKQIKRTSLSINYGDDIQTKIAHLKTKQLRVESAEAESLIKIKNLRKEASEKLHLQSSKKEDIQPRSRMRTRNAKNNGLLGVNENKDLPFRGTKDDVDAKLMQNELERVQEDNDLLRRALTVKEGHNEIIESLVEERDKLHKTLSEEIIKHNDLQNKHEITSRDLEELKVKSKNEIESLQSSLKNQQDGNKKLTSQMRSTTQVLEAELKIQRDYVNDLRAQSWSELATKLKKEVEASVSQELTKSTLSVSQAVGSTEARWKLRIEELQTEHENEIEKLRLEFDTDLRYQLSQNQLKFDNDKLSIEERLKKEYNQSLEVALQQEESLHRSNLRNEYKKWEQVMMDMKIRILTEQQKKHRKNLTDRDDHWRSKITRLQNEADKNAEDAMGLLRTQYDEKIQDKESEFQRALDEAKSKEEDRICTLERKAMEEKSNALKGKEREMIDRLNDESMKLERKFSMAMEKKIGVKSNEEKQRLSMLKMQVGLIKEDNNALKASIQKELQRFRTSLKNEMQNTIGTIISQSNLLMKKRKEEIAREFDEKLFEKSWKHEEAIKAIQAKSKQTLNEQIIIAKENEEKRIEESIQEIAQQYEEQIQGLEYDISWAKSQKTSTEDKAKSLQSALEVNESLLEDSRKDIEVMRKAFNFEKLYIMAKAMSFKKAIGDKETENKHLVEDIECNHKAIEQELRRKVQTLENQSLKYEQRMKLVSSILLNHRRDELIQHKTKSKQVSQEMKERNEKAQVIESARGDILNVLSHLEDEMKDVERRINEHSQVSALQGSGKINIHHARKKRRLDEEYEQIILKIESKREELNSFDEELKECNMKKSELNDKMRGLERSLVELLVDQQKKLLAISSNDDKNKQT